MAIKAVMTDGPPQQGVWSKLVNLGILVELLSCPAKPDSFIARFATRSGRECNFNPLSRDFDTTKKPVTPYEKANLLPARVL